VTSPRPARVLYLVVSAAPPAQKIGELVSLLQERGWATCVIATPRAASWLDRGAIDVQTGYPVRYEYKRPDDPETLPLADAVAVVPATFNTINKWVTGISDTFALGLLNEAIGLRLPIVVAPYAKPTLSAHPAFSPNLDTLKQWGITVLPNEVMRKRPGQPSAEYSYNWVPVVEAIDALRAEDLHGS
jgi:phosphopantothenoylcysteine decarboxylase